MAVRDRDDACPGVVDASSADDGLIVRVRLPGGRLDAARVVELAAMAKRFGTGSVDLTARANVQLRGLTDADLPAVADALAAAGLLPTRSHDRVRNILASPLAGRDPQALADADAVVTAIDEALCASPDLATLSGRFLIAVDDGGVPIATARQDITLLAVAPDTFALLVAGHDTTLRVPTASAADAVIRTAHAFITERAASGAWHIRELPDGPAAFAAKLADASPHPGPSTEPEPEPTPARQDDEATDTATDAAAVTATAAETPSDAPKQPIPPGGGARSRHPLIGVLTQSDGRHAVGALVPLGRLTQRHLAALVAIGGDLRITTTRGILVRDVADPVATAAALEAAGLSCDPASPWRGVTACSGLGACRRASTDVRAAAGRYALSPAAPHPARAATHWVACPRACGKPPGATVLIARPDGGYDVVGPPLPSHSQGPPP
jgi:precorrin-3B synthase